ncbi:MAG: HEAT repeat domain-containing protein, partial [Pirellulales bacterium]
RCLFNHPLRASELNPPLIVNRESNISFNLLGKVKNAAAVPVLIAAIDSKYPKIREQAFHALLKRRCLSGQQVLLSRWKKMPEEWQQELVRFPGAIMGALRNATVDAKGTESTIACDAILHLREYDLLPTMVVAATETKNPNQQLVARTLVKLSELLREDAESKKTDHKRQNLEIIRAKILTTLEEAIRRIDEHEVLEVLDAFLILTSRENSLYREMLKDPLQPNYDKVSNLLKKTRRNSVIDLLMSSLVDSRAPGEALGIIALRRDAFFLGHLMDYMQESRSSVLPKNLHRIQKIAWTDGHINVLDELTDLQQVTAVQFVMECRIDQDQKYNVVKHLLIKGKGSGRLAAIEAMREFDSSEVNQLIAAAVRDEEQSVCAEALSQLRERGVPGSVKILLHYLESPYLIVMDAARKALSEFNFPKYLSSFDAMSEEVRQSSGLIVKKIDLETKYLLLEELKSNSHSRVIRACHVMHSMDMQQEMETPIIDLLGHDDFMVRAEAAELLGSCGTQESINSLRKAMLDRHVRVQEAAEASLQKIAQNEHQKQTESTDAKNPTEPDSTTHTTEQGA